MGAFDDIAPVIIPRSEDERKAWDWEPHEQVILKGSLTVGDQEWLANQMSKAGKKGVDVLLGTGRFGLLERMILSWAFTSNGQAVPVNKGTIARLPSQYSQRILETIDEITGTEEMDEEAQNDFLVSARERIVDAFTSTNGHQTK